MSNFILQRSLSSSFPLFLIPLLPLLGAVFLLIFGRKLRRFTVHFIAVGAVVVAAVVAFLAVFVDLYPLWHRWQEMGQNPGEAVPHLFDHAYTWIQSDTLTVNVSFLLDPLSAIMVMVVTGVGSLIHIYSCGYMQDDPDYARYFAYLNLFMASMLILVLGDNLVLTFVGWEGVGLCSYLLIGYYYDDNAKASAGKKAFIVNRIGDAGFILGMVLLWATLGTLNYTDLWGLSPDGSTMFTKLLDKTWQFFPSDTYAFPWDGQYARVKESFGLVIRPADLIAICLFIGAVGKSAQFPLYVWLPDAMAGPTPVSALIHAATMVTAGVYMIVRLNFVFIHAPGIMTWAPALIGTFTAIFAAIIAFAQNDIKKVLAYSTVSQLGFMFTAVGVGAYSAAIFHLVTHAFFKACLFLGAGAVIHALHGKQDIQKMGGLRKALPVTHWTFLISCLAIAGLPVFAGFFSKDAIILGAFANQFDRGALHNVSISMAGDWVGWLFGITLVIASLCTAFYMFRLYALVFLGDSRADEKTMAHLHIPSNTMRWPLIILAGGASVLGAIGLPAVFQGGSGGAILAVLGVLIGFGLVILGLNHGGPEGAHEQRAMLWHTRIPLTVIGLLVVLMGFGGLGFLSMPADWLASWLKPSIPAAYEAIAVKWPDVKHPQHVKHSVEAVFMLVAVGVGVLGAGSAFLIYRRGPNKVIGSLVAALGGFYRLVENKFYVDEIFDRVIVRPFTWTSGFLRFAIEWLIDGTTKLLAWIVDQLGNVASSVQTGRARQYLAGIMMGVAGLVLLTGPMLRCHSASSEVRISGRDVVIHMKIHAGRASDKVKRNLNRLEVDWDCGGGRATAVFGANRRVRKTSIKCSYAKRGRYTITMRFRDPRYTNRWNVQTRRVTVN